MLFQLRLIVFPPPTSVLPYLSSLVPATLHYPVPLSAGGRQRHRPREHDGNRRLNVLLQEVKDGVPPRPRQVVVRSLTQRMCVGQGVVPPEDPGGGEVSDHHVDAVVLVSDEDADDS